MLYSSVGRNIRKQYVYLYTVDMQSVYSSTFLPLLLPQQCDPSSAQASSIWLTGHCSGVICKHRHRRRRRRRRRGNMHVDDEQQLPQYVSRATSSATSTSHYYHRHSRRHHYHRQPMRWWAQHRIPTQLTVQSVAHTFMCSNNAHCRWAMVCQSCVL